MVILHIAVPTFYLTTLYMQDGAPVHVANSTLEYLDKQFGDLLLVLKSKRGIHWVPRSPELNAMDFWTWAYLKT